MTAAQCPVCGTREPDALHIPRCQYAHAARADVVAHAARSGVPEPAAADLWAHLRDIYDDGSRAHRAARQVLDLGWRPGGAV